MRSRRKPDLLIFLVIFVVLGVIFSTTNQNDTAQVAPAAQEATVPSSNTNKPAKETLRGKFVEVSNPSQSVQFQNNP